MRPSRTACLYDRRYNGGDGNESHPGGPPMRIIAAVRAALDDLFRRDRVERDLGDELRAYLELLTEEKIRLGLTAADARRAALSETGGVGHVKEEVGDTRTGARRAAFTRDLTHALRGLRRTPGFAVAV